MAFLQGALLPLLLTTFVFHAALCQLTTQNKSSVAALLKHQTPIAGTNLFLNTPYKWHDHTKPGCYATWFMEKYAEWSEKFKGIRMVCNKHDQQWYETADAAWIFERTSGAESVDEYHGTVKIKNIGADATLETWKSSNTWWVGLGAYAANPSEDMWNVQSDSSNKNHVQLDIQSWFIAQDPAPNHQTYIYLKMGETAGFPYSFVPAIELEAKMYDFEFTKPLDGQVALHSSKKDLIDSYDINNDSPSTLSRTVKVSEKITNEFAWGFSESLKTFAKVTGSAGIPFLAEGKVETGIELTLNANQNWRNSVEKLFEMTYDVKVPEHTSVRVSAWYELIKGISMDYTATIEITGTSTRITMFDDIVKDSRATGEMIRRQLDYTKFDGKIVEIKEYSVIAQTKGTMVASVGVRGQLNVDGKTVVALSVPQ